MSTGRYDFKGIKTLGAAAVIAALETTGWGAFLIRWGFRAPLELLLQSTVNWLANEGLVVLNLGAIFIGGDWDQKAFDAAMQDAIQRVQQSGPLTPEQQKVIDDDVIKAFRKFAVLTR